MRFWSLLVIPVATSLILIACGSSNSGNGGGDGGVGDSTIGGPEGSLGGGDSAFDAGGPCQPKTCAQLGYTCGKNSDGCGNILDCGTCTSPQFCGGGGYSVCGGKTTVADGGNPCVPTTCA